MKKSIYTIRGEVWLYPGETGNWHFVTVPKKESVAIKKRFGALKRGWGSLPVTVTIGETKWQTSIFPDKKIGGYVLPLKADVRKKEGVTNGATITFLLEIRARSRME